MPETQRWANVSANIHIHVDPKLAKVALPKLLDTLEDKLSDAVRYVEGVTIESISINVNTSQHTPSGDGPEVKPLGGNY